MQAYLNLTPFIEIAAALDAVSSFPCLIVSNGTPTMLNSTVQSAGFSAIANYNAFTVPT